MLYAIHPEPRKYVRGYRAPAILHYVSPRNRGRVEHADGCGHASSATEDEHLEISLKLDDDFNVSEARFRSTGCPALVAAGSVLTQLITKNPLCVAVALTPDDLDVALGGLPALRRYTTTLAITALHRAVLMYYERTQPKPRSEAQSQLAF